MNTAIGVNATPVPNNNVNNTTALPANITNLLYQIDTGRVTQLTSQHQEMIGEFLGIPAPQLQGLSAADLRSVVMDAREQFQATAQNLGISTTGTVNIGSDEYAGMSIQEKIFALMLSAIDKQEKSLEKRFEMMAQNNAKVDTFNAVSEQLGALSGKLDPTKPDSTVDITQATIQIKGEDGTMKEVNMANYLRDAGITLPEDLENVNQETLSGLQGTIKDNTESVTSTSQTDLLKLQTESSKLSRLYEMTTAMMKNMSDACQNIISKL
jgi:hypothetical protein